MSVSVEERLTKLRGPYAAKRPNARTIASLRENPACSRRRVLDAAGIDKGELARDLGSSVISSQSPFAIARGDRFERDVKADGYAMAIALLRDHGYPVEPMRSLPLRDIHPINPGVDVDAALKARAEATREALVDIARDEPGAYNLIDGGALEWDLGGAVARLEADGVAWRLDGRIHVVEIKSFPIVDGIADPDKAGAAAWQGAVYLSAIAELLTGEGLPLTEISTKLLLVCPRNTSLQPTLTPIEVSSHVRSLKRLLDSRESIVELLDDLPPELTLATEAGSAEERAEDLAQALEKIGNRYTPNCLSTCELAQHCRKTARAYGHPTVVGPELVAGIAGVASMDRAAELASGAKPKPEEREAAEHLRTTAELLDRLGV